MSAPFLLATRLLSELGIDSCTVSPVDGDWADADVTTTPTRRLYPGMVAKIRNRVRMAVLDHRRHMGEDARVLDEAVTLLRVQTGPDVFVWRISHDSCRLNRFTTGSAA